MQNSEYPGVALVGSGYWGRNLVRNFHALGALRAVCDSNEQVLATLRAQYQGIKTTPSFAEILADPTVQSVAIAAPAALHAPLARQALLTDKDVLNRTPQHWYTQAASGSVFFCNRLTAAVTAFV